MASTLFGKPKSKVIKHPGVFAAAAARHDMSTRAYAEAHKHDKGKLGERARLALTMMSWHKK